MGRRRLYCATLRARRTKRLDQRHEIDRDRDETLLVLETVSRPRPRDRDHIPVSLQYATNRLSAGAGRAYSAPPDPPAVFRGLKRGGVRPLP